MGYKNGQYWREPQDAWMATVLTGDSNTKEWLTAYKLVLPRLRKMGESILRRYYSWVTDKVAQDLITDAIASLIVKGDYNPDKPKMFAYCGTIIKRYFYSELVSPTLRKQTVRNNLETNYDINDNEWLIDEYAIEPNYEFDITERQELYDGILKIIDDGIAECDAVLGRNHNRNDYMAQQGSIKEKEVLLLAREYFERNFMEATVSIKALADYVNDRMDEKDYVISKYLIRYFNIGSLPTRIDGRKKAVDFVKKRGESSYMMDDYAPNESANVKARRNSMRKNYKGYEYF